MAFRESYERIETPCRNIFDTIRSLNLVKSFREGEVTDWRLERVLDTAIWGPNPENFKMWRYIVVKDTAAKEFLYKLVNERKHTPFYFNDPEWQYARLWYVEEGKRLEKVEEMLEAGIGDWYIQADVLIIPLIPLPLASGGWSDSAHMAVVLGGRNPISSITLGCCIQNMLIAATALELGVNFDPHIASDSRMEEPVRNFFGIPPSWRPMGVIGLGYPGEPLERPPIPPIDFFFYEEYWGNPYQI
jgi:nitroreductase